MKDTFIVESYFDGENHQNKGPYVIKVNDGIVTEIGKAQPLDQTINPSVNNIYTHEFLMPGLVEAHCHLFLDGGELDFKKRSAYLKSDRENMLNVCRKNIDKNLAHGISLIRDAGDIHGLNQQIKSELSEVKNYTPMLRSPGTAIRKTKRYGSFMAREVDNINDIEKLITETSPNIDDLKVLITGIIDFDAGAVKGKPQFSEEELLAISKKALECNIQTFAHCSGVDGIKLAIKTHMNSIEHGFFMETQYLEAMAEKNISWVPTYSPVHFQWDRPELANWSKVAVTKLRQILDNHLEQIKKANKTGVSLIAGSDAGSYGVEHGKALIDELFFFEQAGLSTKDILISATTEPRRKWNCRDASIKVNNKADFLVLENSPFKDLNNIKKVVGLYNGNWSEASIPQLKNLCS